LALFNICSKIQKISENIEKQNEDAMKYDYDHKIRKLQN